MRAAAGWLLAGLGFSAVIALAVLTVGLALLAAPMVLLAARLLARARPSPRRRAAGGAVYEGEFRVLDETVEERA